MKCTKKTYCTRHKSTKRLKLTVIAYLLAFYVATIGVCIDRQCLAEPQIISPVVASSQLATVVGSKSTGESATPPPVRETLPVEQEGDRIELESREDKLKAYLESKNSPLAPHAHFIVKMADEYDISYTLVVAISGKETSFGLAGEGPSFYNAWGIMSWDSQGKRSQRRFNNWQESIEYTTKLLSKNYRADMNKGIQQRYCPSFECSSTWVGNVTKFQEEINSL